MLEEPSIQEVPKLQKSSGAANEQGSREKLAWLAGIIDGEGYIGVVRARRTGTNEVRAYSPSITVNNSDFEMIQAVAMILEAHGIRYHANPTTKGHPQSIGRSERRYMVLLKVGGMKSCLKLIGLVLPFMVAKRREAEILAKYCGERLAEMSAARKVLTPTGYMNTGCPPNLLGECYIAELEAERAKQYDPSETTRRPSYFRLNDRVG